MCEILMPINWSHSMADLVIVQLGKEKKWGKQ